MEVICVSQKKTQIMKYILLLSISILLFSCKEDNAVSPPSLINTKWDLIETREALTCCNFVKDFNWKNYKIDGNVVTYEFTNNRIEEYSYCPTCLNTTFIQRGEYMSEDNSLKIIGDSNNTQFRIYGNLGTKIVKLTNDTLIVGKGYGREGDYSEFKFIKLK